MMFSIFCSFSARNWFNLSKWALTTVCGWPNLRWSVRGASYYILPQYANYATAIFALPVASVSQHVGLTSSKRVAESRALSNWPNHSCYWRGLPLYWDSFQSGRMSSLDVAHSCASSWKVEPAGTIVAAWSNVGMYGGALILNGVCWREVVVIPV